MNKYKILRCFLVTVPGILFFVKNAYANIVFPAIAHQFMVSLVVPYDYSVIMAIAILLIEAFFIQKLFNVKYGSSFILSFMINLVSSVAGVFIVSFLEGVTREFCLGIFGYANMRLGTYLGMIPGYILTVLLEGGLLFLIALAIKNKQKMILCMKVSMVMNCLSYLIVFIGIVIADIMTKGANFKTF